MCAHQFFDETQYSMHEMHDGEIQCMKVYSVHDGTQSPDFRDDFTKTDQKKNSKSNIKETKINIKIQKSTAS